MKFLYRYEDVQYAAPLNEWDEPCGEGPVEVNLRKFPVVRETKCGAWINVGFLEEELKFVLLTARKRFACPTLEDARISFVARKNAQARIYEAKLQRVRRALARLETRSWLEAA